MRSRMLPQLKGVEFEVFWDQGTHVKESIHNLTSSGLWGGLFASMVLFAFMRAIRMTVILTLAIPLSILTTVVVMYFIGWSLNMATMMGLLLCIGLVIDNSIVIVENIYRYRQAGLPGRQASIRGAGEVGLAVTIATLTTVVVFLPLDPDERRAGVFVLDAPDRDPRHRRPARLALHRPGLRSPGRPPSFQRQTSHRTPSARLAPEALPEGSQLGAPPPGRGHSSRPS